DRLGVRVLDGERPRLAVGAESPTRPLLESLYTLPHHMAFLEAQGIDAAVFGPLMDVAGYSLPPDQGAAWSRAPNEGLGASLAAGSLILGGTLDRFPSLDVVLVHGGGFLPYHVGRFDRGHTTRPEARSDGASLPSTYLRRFHYDTLVQFTPALAYLVGVAGADRVLLGSDHPFWLGDPEPLRIVREAGLSKTAEAAILGGNAARLFHVKS